MILIDQNEAAFRKLSPAYAGLMLTGDATDRATLNQAELNRADHLVIVTNNDNTNIDRAAGAGMLPDAADHLPAV